MKKHLCGFLRMELTFLMGNMTFDNYKENMNLYRIRSPGFLFHT